MPTMHFGALFGGLLFCFYFLQTEKQIAFFPHSLCTRKKLDEVFEQFYCSFLECDMMNMIESNTLPEICCLKNDNTVEKYLHTQIRAPLYFKV